MKLQTLVKILKIELERASKNEILEIIHELNEIYKKRFRKEG